MRLHCSQLSSLRRRSWVCSAAGGALSSSLSLWLCALSCAAYLHVAPDTLGRVCNLLDELADLAEAQALHMCVLELLARLWVPMKARSHNHQDLVSIFRVTVAQLDELSVAQEPNAQRCHMHLRHLRRIAGELCSIAACCC